MDYPIQRHSTSEFLAITKNVAFMLRSVSTVGNYDYEFTYSFHRDGTVSVRSCCAAYSSLIVARITAGSYRTSVWLHPISLLPEEWSTLR